LNIDNITTVIASGTGVGTNAGVTVTIAAVSAPKPMILSPLGIQVSGDTACIVTIESPAATILYRKRFAAAFVLSEAFSPGAIKGAAGQALLVKISASTSNCEANIQAAEIPR
jgi:hypothetical protein